MKQQHETQFAKKQQMLKNWKSAISITSVKLFTTTLFNISASNNKCLQHLVKKPQTKPSDIWKMLFSNSLHKQDIYHNLEGQKKSIPEKGFLLN